MKVCAVNFWPGFSLETGLINHLLRLAIGEFSVVLDQAAADLVFTSVYGINNGNEPKFPRKTICLIWENLRPNYALYEYSLSQDFDQYGGRNCRMPYWYHELAWPGMIPEKRPPNEFNHGYEAPIDVTAVTRSRHVEIGDREHFCCFIAGSRDLHRVHAVEELSRYQPVDVFGNIAKRPLRASKFETLAKYRFNLCFENSTFPGYYTEKPLHAWFSGCVPLYYSDPWFRRDFNPKALVNRIDFPTLEEYVRRVVELDSSKDLRDEIVSQPLMQSTPSLEPIVEFLQEACARIADPARSARAKQRSELVHAALFSNAVIRQVDSFSHTASKLPGLFIAAIRRRLGHH